MFHALAFAALLAASEFTRPDEVPDATSPPGPPVLSGSVSGPELQRLVDVVVTITGPSIDGEIVVVTDELGEFRAPVPAGIVTLRFEKEGFRPFVRTGWEVSGGKGARIAIELLPEAPGEVVIYLCCGLSQVDTGSAKEGGTGSLSSFAPLPLAPPLAPGGASRSFDTLLRVFPGIRAGAGGSRNGADPARELSASLDGIPIREPVTGLLALPITSALVDEASALTGSPDASRGGSTSGWLEATTLSGGNEFHGRVFTTLTPSSLSSASTSLGDVGAGLGGYLVRDRLWFAASGQWPWSAPVSLEPGPQGLLRLTALISPDARVEVRYADAGARLLDHAVRSRLAALSGAFAAFDKRLLLDVQGWWMGVSDRSAAPGPALSSQSAGGSGTLTALVTAWGHHLLKLGVEGRSSHAGAAGRDVLSAFIDENWSVADRFVLLLGARTDVQQLRDGVGESTVSGGLLPRLGVVFDPTQQGLAKIFGWWGRLEDDVPLGLLGGSATPIAFASGLRPPVAEAWSLGTQYEMRPVVAGLRYSERRLLSAISRMETGDGLTVVNPAEGNASGVARPTRLERSLTASVSMRYFDRWVLEASARLARLQANVLSTALLETSPARVLAPEEAWLPELKVAVGRSIVLGPGWQLQLGSALALWRTIPETERFAPTASDLAWTGRVDVRVAVEWSDGHSRSAAVSLEAFDLLDTDLQGDGRLDGRSVRLGASMTF